MRSLKLVTFLFLLRIATYAQTAPQTSLVDIKQEFNKLNVLGSVLYVAAHPDDENTRLLAYLAQEKHYRTGYLSLTRGDGGQNLIGTEQGELLGLIRTQELLAARHIDGAEQFFTRANDFGFSKGPDETLKIWDREQILGDVVWVIRKFKPDVIICRWPTTGEGGHGHHTASAILAQEAFTAAANPKRFPEQLQFVQPWQAKRLLFNSFNFGSLNTTAESQFKLDVGVYNPVLGKGYGEIAGESRSEHKSQGMGTANERGGAIEYFKTILGDAPHTDLMDGINTTWKRISNTDGLDGNINIIAKQFDENIPATSVPGLVKVLSRVEKLSDTYWREQKTKELKNLIAACAGLWFEAYTTEPTYAIGDTMKVRAQIIDRYDTGYKINRIYADAGLEAIPAYQNSISFMAGASLNIQNIIPANKLQTFNLIDAAGKITQPYWLERPRTLGAYFIPNQQLVGNPENPGLPKVTFEFIIEGKPITFERRLVYKSIDPVRGEVYRNVEVTPPVTANIDNSVYVFKDVSTQKIAVKLKSFTQASGSIGLKAPAGWKIAPEQIAFAGKKKGEEWTETFTVSPLDNQSRNDVLKVITTVNGADYQMGLKRMAYNHIPAITVFPPAQTKLLKLNIQTSGKNIGYIAGAGDLVPDALRQLGYKVNLLNEEEVMKSDLSGYDAIITGVRAYNVNDRMAVEQPKLLNYVKNGGNLVIQYNNNAGLVTPSIGPYPFQVINQRITDEDAKVTILDAQSPLLNYPNKITQSDFDGWVQERSIYHVDNIDPKYKTIFEMNDPNEAPNNGSLITTDYGKGRFIYTSLVFFRELPAGVPGAYRLFVNLLSKPAN